MTDQRQGCFTESVAKSCQVKHVLGDRIDRARRPLAVAMPAQIECANVIVIEQRRRHPVPAARMVQSTMNQDNEWSTATIIPVVQFEPVRAQLVWSGLEQIPNHLRAP